MRRWTIALMAGACLAHPALAAEPIGYTAPDGVNAVPVTAANPLPVGTSDSRATGQINAASLNAAYAVSLNGGDGVVGFAISGLTASGAALTIEGANDGGTIWSPIQKVDGASGALASAITADGNYKVDVGGRAHVRLRVSAAGAGTIGVASNASAASSIVQVGAPLPPGGNTLGAVNLNAGANTIGAISNTAFGISGSLPAGISNIGRVTPQVGGADVGATNPVPVGGFQVTPATGAAAAIATGGAAVTVISGPINGGFVQNPIDAAGQGIASAENAYLDMVGAPGSTDGAGNGTTTILQPGQPFYLPALPSGVNVKVNAATTGHKLTVVKW